MNERLAEIDLPRLHQLAAESEWFDMANVVGEGPTCMVNVVFNLAAFASRPNQDEPEVHPGPWRARIALARGVAIQPLVQLESTDGFLPVSGNISDARLAIAIPPGLVCYSDRWDPTQLTIPWVVFQVARVLVGEVLNLEAEPLSKSGRDFQAAALQRGDLPTVTVSPPQPELLYLQPADSDPTAKEVEFDEP